LAVMAVLIFVWLLRENLDLSTAKQAHIHIDSKHKNNVDGIKVFPKINTTITASNTKDVANATTTAAAVVPVKKEPAVGTTSDLYKQIIDDQATEIQTLRATIKSLEDEHNYKKREGATQTTPEVPLPIINKSKPTTTPSLRVVNVTATEDNDDDPPIMANSRVGDNDNKKTNANNAMEYNHSSSCPVPSLGPPEFSSDLAFYKVVHESPFPTCAAGSWVYKPEERMVLSEAHLRCLDQERQGNCHDPDAWKHTNDTAKQSRYNSILKNAVRNSPGILNASDPWVWKSTAEAYRVMDHHDMNAYRLRVRKLFASPAATRIYFVGGSLTRQWQHVMKCELEHVVGIDPNLVE